MNSGTDMNFRDLVDLIGTKSPLQKKRLHGYLAGCDDAFFREADEFVMRYGSFLDERGIPIDYAVDAYLKMCNDMLRCQVAFLRSGRYPVASAQQAATDVYHSEREMLSYMVGLGISQFLWATHYQMFGFFKQAITERAGSVASYLEIGPGHGLLLESALSRLHRLSQAVAIDISQTSLDLTKAIINHFVPDSHHVCFLLGDIMHADIEERFDFIAMGEVLEHVEQPRQLLGRLRNLLAPDGRVFISTCANCPAIDHVYQFDEVRQIRDLIRESGFGIDRDLPLPVENMTVDAAEKARVTINYCALLR